MNEKHVQFVVVWTLAPSLEAAANVLGMKVRSVTRQANRMRAAGVKLKPLTDPRFNPHNKPKDVPLTVPQRQFMEAYYDFARRVAWKKCRALDVARSKVEDLVEDATTTALVSVSRRSTAKDFVPETVLGLVATAVRRQLCAILRDHFGKTGQKKLPNHAVAGPVDWVPAPCRTPLEEVISQEEQRQLCDLADKARAILGPMPDMSRQRESPATRELLTLRSKARQLGINAHGPTKELLERIAAHVRGLLVSEPSLNPVDVPESPVPDPVPEVLRQRASRVAPPSNPKQREAERFVRVWETSSSAAEVARRLGRALRSVVGYAGYLKSLGVRIRNLPTNLRPVLQGVMRLQPSLN